MTLGDKITKPVLTQEECDNYASYAEWCNSNDAHIEDKGEYYEIVKNEKVEPQPETASDIDKISAQVMYTALMTDTLLDEESEAE